MHLLNYDIFENLRTVVIMFQILLCTHMVSFSYKKKNMYTLRLVLSSLISIGILFAIPKFEFEISIVEYIYETFFYVILSLLTYLNVRFCYEVSKKESYFSLIAGYTIQHIGYTLFSMIDIVFLNSIKTANTFFEQYIFVRRLSFTSIFILLSIYPYIIVKKEKGTELANKNILLILTFSLFSNVFLSLGISKKLDILTYEMMKMMNLLCCLLMMFVLFYLRRKVSMQKKIMQLNLIQEEQARLYKMNLNNREIMNIKAHDLKHQLSRINTLDNNTKKELEKVVSLYDSEFSYKRESLNIVLQEKDVICRKHQIELNVLIEEEALNFISDTDLYSLFGNILDNAIEACLKVNTDKLIILRVKNISNIITIKETNNFNGKLRFDKNGNVLTTKKDDGFHGFGLKSIKMIAEKYNGEIEISSTESNFTLCLYFNK